MRWTVLPELLQKKLTKFIRFDCMEKCLIYLLTCNKYREQYVGQIVKDFAMGEMIRANFCKHALCISCLQEHLCKHFRDNDFYSGFNCVSVKFTDKTDSTNPLQKENYWKSTLKTFAPYSLTMCSGLIAGFDPVYKNRVICIVDAAFTHIDNNYLLLTLDSFG